MFLMQGNGMPRPYDHNNPMNMIRHNQKGIQFGVAKMSRNILPRIYRNFPIFIQSDFPIHDPPKQTFPGLRTYGYKISSCLGIIITVQSNGTAVIFCRIIGHTINTRSRGTACRAPTIVTLRNPR